MEGRGEGTIPSPFQSHFKPSTYLKTSSTGG